MNAPAPTPGVGKRKKTAVIFHDLLDDRETETGALAASRHVGLGEALAPLLRQALAVVLDDNAYNAVPVAPRERDLAWRQRRASCGFPALDRLGRILENICQHLRDLAAVAD